MWDFYGLEAKSFSEEMELPENARRTRNNKVEIATKLDMIMHVAETMRSGVKFIPEIDDGQHADLVQRYRNEIQAALVALDNANKLRYGG